ncbi:MAG TPA: ABC transporter substrate-binding protein [Zeimonas sp.]|nr:ABC transporter substrate-binding protein [Zeimonas sp.]
MSEKKMVDAGSRVALGRRQWISMVGGMAAAGSLGLASGDVLAQAPRRGGVLRIVAPLQPTSMDPYAGRHGNDHVYLFPAFDSLIDVDLDTLEPKPGLAQSWSFPDSTTLVLNLRPGVVFHDGTPCDAEAVRYNLERAKSHERSNVKIDMKSVDSIAVTGPSQVTLKLTKPDSVILMTLADRAGMMSSPTAIKAAGNEYGRVAVGAGPWRLVSWKDNEKLVYERHPQYWAKDVALLDGLEFSVIPEVNTGLRTVVAGQNDFVYGLAPQQKPIIERSGLQMVQGSTLATWQIYLNYSKPPFDNVKVRQAMHYALDRDEFSRLTTAGMAEPTTQTLPRGHWGYDKTLEGTYKHDPKRARELLAEAGYPNGIDVEVIGRNDQRSQQQAEVLIEQYRKSGIRLKFMNVPANELGAKFMGERIGNAAVSVYTGRVDPSQLYSIMFDKSSFINASRMEGAPGLEAAMEAARAVYDKEARRQAVWKIQRIVHEHALYVPLALQPELDAMSQRVKGFKPNLLGKPRFHGVWLAAS